LNIRDGLNSIKACFILEDNVNSPQTWSEVREMDRFGEAVEKRGRFGGLDFELTKYYF